MKQMTLILALCWLCSCNTLYVSQNKTSTNTPTIGVEWNFGDFQNEGLQRKVDSVILAELKAFNSGKHAFTVYARERRDKGKDYITIDVTKGKVVGTGGKIAGYTVTTLGLFATPALLIATESPVILGFYYWPNHNINSKITLSANLSGEKRNTRNLAVTTGALFASTDKQVDKLLRKFAEGIHKTLLDIETQLSR